MLRTIPRVSGYVLLCFTLILLFFHPVVFSGQTFFFRDIHRWFFPMKHFLGEALKGGNLPYWCPNYFCGAPFMSDIQSGVFYPLSLIFGLLPAPLSFNWFILLHILLAGLFFYLFIHLRGHSESAALITSLSYAFGGCTLSSINVLNNLTTLVWLPAVLGTFCYASRHRFRKGLFLSILCLCCAVLGGEPQLFIFIGGLLILSCLISPENTTFTFRLKHTLAALAVIIFAIGLTMFQTGPLYTDYLQSVRLGGLQFNEAAQHSLPLASLKHFVYPLIFPSNFTADPASLSSFSAGEGQLPWLLSTYPGFIIVPLAIAGIVFRASGNTRYWAIVFLFAALLSLGGNTPFYKLFFKLVPFFRYPEKFIFICNFCLLIMAAQGIDTVRARLENVPLRPVFISFLLTTTLMADLYMSNRYLNPICSAGVYRQLPFHFKPVRDDSDLFRLYADAEYPPGMTQSRTILGHHARWRSLMMPNLGLLYGFYQVGGISGLELRYQYFITELLSKPWPQKINFLRMANVKYIVSDNRLDKIPSLVRHIEPINSKIYRIIDPLPRAWLVGKLQPVKKGVLEELSTPSFNMKQSALTWGRIVENYQNPVFKKVNRVEYRPNSTIHIDLTADEPSILVLSESFYPGWRVMIDGVEKQCLKLNYLFQGVEVEKGPHQVVFAYRPLNLTLFAAISAIILLLLLLSWTGITVYNRRDGNNAWLD